jgi:hypothetical protein
VLCFYETKKLDAWIIKMAVLTAQGQPPHAHNIAQITHGIPDRVDFGLLAIVPQDGELSHAIATSHRKIQDFDIKGGHSRPLDDWGICAVDLGTMKEIVGHGGTKRFEATLCVMKIANHN